MNEYEGLYEYTVEQNLEYAILCYKGEEIVHICLYPSQPTAATLSELIEELDTDPEFGFIGQAKELEYKCKRSTDTDFPDEWDSLEFLELN